MRLATQVSGVSLKLKITPRWMEPDSHLTQGYSSEQSTHTHTHMHTHNLISVCAWKHKPLEKAEERQPVALKQVACAGKLPSEVFSGEWRLPESPSFTLTSSTGQRVSHVYQSTQILGQGDTFLWPFPPGSWKQHVSAMKYTSFNNVCTFGGLCHLSLERRWENKLHSVSLKLYLVDTV